MSPRRSCPRCLSSTVRRSRRKLYDLPYTLLGRHASRCTACGLRFFDRSSRQVRTPARLNSVNPLKISSHSLQTK